MTYNIEFTTEARIGLAKLERSEPKAFAQAVGFIEELKTHPKTGTGHPEPLKGAPLGRWSRQITKKHRLVYQIMDEEIIVLILRSYGHYNDK